MARELASVLCLNVEIGRKQPRVNAWEITFSSLPGVSGNIYLREFWQAVTPEQVKSSRIYQEITHRFTSFRSLGGCADLSSTFVLGKSF